MKLPDDFFMFLLHDNNICEGDTIYYVISENGHYAIHKTQIVEKTLHRKSGFRSFFDTYIYRCSDGYTFDSIRINQPVFDSRHKAITYITHQLEGEINLARIDLDNARERLSQLQRSLKLNEKYLCRHNSE